MGIAAMVLLLPKNMRHFSDLMAAVALITLVAVLSRRASRAAACRPSGDGFSRARTCRQLARRVRAQESGRRRDGDDHLHRLVRHAHAQPRARRLIMALAAIFLGFSQSKTAIGVLPLVLVLSASSGAAAGRQPALALVVVILVAFNLFSVGTVIFEPVRKLVELVMPDATFTGRTEIWQIGLRGRGPAPDHRLWFLRILRHRRGRLWSRREHELGQRRDRRAQRLSQSRFDHRPARPAADDHLDRGPADRGFLSPAAGC